MSSFPNIPPSVRSATSRKRRRAKEEERRGSSLLLRECDTQRWAQAQGLIRELYKTYSLRVVIDIMWSVYQFGSRDENDFNRKALKGAQKTKQERTKGVRKHDVGALIMSMSEFDLRLPVPYLLGADQHKHQERLLYSVDRCVYRMFDTGKKGHWSANIAGLIPADETPTSAGIDAWQLLSDQCHSASILVQAGMVNKAEKTLQRIIRGLEVPAIYVHAGIMIKIWRILVQLEGLQCRCPQLNPVQRVLHALVASTRTLSHTEKKQHADTAKAIYQLALSLSNTPRAERTDTLRIGTFKTVKEMTQVIGEQNVVVMSMWSYYCKMWEPRSLDQKEYLEKLNTLKSALEGDLERNRQGLECQFTAEERVSIAYHYTYGAYYVCKATDVLRHLRRVHAMAVTLPCLGDKPWWTLGTQAFAFSAKVLAEAWRRRARSVGKANDLTKWEHCCAWAMNFIQAAVQRLEQGDAECRTRAAMLAAQLARWLEEWQLDEIAQEWRERTMALYSSLEGVDPIPCIKCTRKRMCRDCLSLR